MSGRTAIIVSCSHAQCRMVHGQARSERRTISAYVLRVVLGNVTVEEDFPAKSPAGLRELVRWKRLGKAKGPRTTFLVRCSSDEAGRIRTAAKRRDISISGYVLAALHRSWKAQVGVGRMSPDKLPDFEDSPRG